MVRSNPIWTGVLIRSGYSDTDIHTGERQCESQKIREPYVSQGERPGTDHSLMTLEKERAR